MCEWTIESIRELLDKSDAAVERAILAIYARQTEDEKASETTKHRNGRGFTAFDAGRGTYYANWIKSGRHLSGRFLETARRMSKWYAGQLIEVIDSKSQTTNPAAVAA